MTQSRRAIGRGEVPGAVVLVLHQDRVVYRKAFGHRVKRPEHTLMAEDTVFDLASLTKPIFTALAIMLLGQDGKLSVDDPLARHLPAFARKETEQITIAQLLTHTGGFIADNRPRTTITRARTKPGKGCSRLNPTAAPGSRFVYSDVGYILLGKIVEKAGGMPLGGVCIETDLRPARHEGYRLSAAGRAEETLCPDAAARRPLDARRGSRSACI